MGSTGSWAKGLLSGLAPAFVLLSGSGCDHNQPATQTGGASSSSAAAPSSQAPPPPAAPTGAAVAPAPPPGPTNVPDKACGGQYVVDDMEDNDNQVAKAGGRNGYWYTFIDKAGSTISPPAKTKFIQSPGGAGGSKYAAHFLGQMSKEGDPLFSGMGASLTDPKGLYDASKYTGVSFWAKAGPGSTKNVRLKVPDVNTDPQGKVCAECFNDFGADLTLTDQWKKYTIPFATMKQMEGWGSPNPATIDKSKLYAIQWQVTERGVATDVWVDDVQFTGCP